MSWACSCSFYLSYLHVFLMNKHDGMTQRGDDDATSSSEQRNMKGKSKKHRRPKAAEEAPDGHELTPVMAYSSNSMTAPSTLPIAGAPAAPLPDAAHRSTLWSTIRDHVAASLKSVSTPKGEPLMPKRSTAEHRDICKICLEDGAPRKCCKEPYCDYCFCNRQNCPSCGVPLDRGEPVLKDHHAHLEVKEVLECRRCLKPGFRRRCCQEYYCNECYYMTGFCPSCGAQVTNTGMSTQAPLEDPGYWPVFWSYFLSIFFTLFAVVFAVAFLANDVTMPKTVSGFTCYGVMPKCTKTDTCIAWDADAVGGGHGSSEAVPNMTSWRRCDLRTPVKMMNPTCVFDQELYSLSNHTLGFDFCASSFENGMYTMHDEFELWANKTTGWRKNGLGSAKWAHIINGQVDQACGVGQGNRSLHFGGVGLRYAETEPLDMSYGGVIKFMLAFGAQSNSIYTSTCKPAFSGNVMVRYSVDRGKTWGLVSEYAAARYPDGAWNSFVVAIPKGAYSNATRFRFQQSDFNELRDHWAIDNIKILHTFPPGWKTSSLMSKVKAKTQHYIHDAQCCYRTMQCQSWRLNRPPSEATCRRLPNYEQQRVKPLHGVELYIVIVFIASILRTGYGIITSLTGTDWITRLRKFKQVSADKPPPGMLSGTFRLRVNTKWQLLAAMAVVIPTLLMFYLNGLYVQQQLVVLGQRYHAFGRHGYAVHPHVELMSIYFMTLYLDTKDAVKVLSKILCVFPKSVPEVSVDATPHINTLKIGADTIGLDDVTEVTRFSLKYCKAQAARLLIGALPYASTTLLLGVGHVHFAAYRVLRFAGLFCSMLKAFCGPEWLIKLWWFLEYFWSSKTRSRDEIGLQLKKPKIWFLSGYWALLGGVVSLFTLAIVKYEWLAAGFFVTVTMCAILGMGLGVAQGLPLVPLFVLTTVDTGVYLRVTRKKQFPCMYRCKHWARIHQHDELVIVFVDEDGKFIPLLKGMPPPGALASLA